MEGDGGYHPQPPGRRALFLLLPRHPGRQLGRRVVRAAAVGAFGALRRRQLVRRGANVLSTIIQRGVESGAFRPHCARWAVQRLPYAIVAGVCARWVFGLPEERSLGAGAAADAALEALCPPVLASR